MTCLHCGAINKDTANFCKDCGMKFTTQKEQDIGTHEDRFYEIAMEELESRSYVKGIWAKAFSQSNADEAIAKALYIKFRVQSLKEEFIAKRKLEEERVKQEKIRAQKEAQEKEKIRAQEKEKIRAQEKEKIRAEEEAKEKERTKFKSQKVYVESCSNLHKTYTFSLFSFTICISKKNKEKEQVWTDKDTGFMWEIKTQENIEHQYVWSKEEIQTAHQPKKLTDDVKDAFSYAEKLNANNYAGFNDWRVPTIEELETLLTKKYNLSNNYYYWSSTTNAYYTDLAWYVSFSLGGTSLNAKTNSLYVRCVRGGQ